MKSSPRPVWPIPCIALVSGALLLHEILLTRTASLRFMFHYSFLVVGLALLGLGLGGSLVALTRERWAERHRGFIAIFAGLQALALCLAWAVAVLLPVSQSIKEGLGGFLLFFSAGALPFFLGGTVLGLLFANHGHRVSRLYASDLAGAALGALLAPLLLPAFGAGGGEALAVTLSLLGLVVATPPAWRLRTWSLAFPALLVAGVMVFRVDTAWPLPTKSGRQPLASWWTPLSRIDAVAVELERRTLFTRGAATSTMLLPAQVEILQDGTASTFVSDFSSEPEALEILDRSLYSAALHILEKPRVLVIGAGGGNDLWAAQRHEASFIRAVELNGPVMRVHRELVPEFSRDLLANPALTWERAEGRSWLLRDRERYDLVQMSGIDTWAALASGAYMLAENYLYTQEAFEAALDRLEPGGIVQVIRMAADTETLRLLAVEEAALRNRGMASEDFAKCIAVFASPDQLVATLVKPDGFTVPDTIRLDAFTRKAGLDVLYLPGFDVRRLVGEFVTTEARGNFIRTFPKDITPPTDNRPYFFFFDRWTADGSAGQPSHVAQGNPWFVLAQLGVSFMVALLGVGICMLAGGGRAWRDLAGGRWPTLLYFTMIGVGFMAVELTLVQQSGLLLGHPMYALPVTLAGLLVAMGVGSLASAGWDFEGRQRFVVPAAVCAWLLIWALIQAWLLPFLLPLPLWIRVVSLLVLLLPLGFILGIPFALGLRRVDQGCPSALPLAWAVNALATVVGSHIFLFIAMNLGFHQVMIFSALVYGAAFLLLPRLPRAARP